jgi:predicted permease
MNRHDLLLRIRGFFLRRRAEQELDEELRFHLEMQTRKNAALGASSAEAARLARIRFGGLDPVKEECRTVRGTQLIETTLRDIQYALRGFRRSPLFVLTVIGTIALGLGLNTALFTIFSTYVLRPLSVHDPYSLYSFVWTNRSGSEHRFSWRDFEKFRETNPAFSEVVATEYLFGRMDGRPMAGELVTGNYFKMLGVSGARGRTLLPEDGAASGKDPVMVLSYSTWRDKFGADPDIVGKKLVVRGYPLQVIGVAKEGFGGLMSASPDYWAPLTMAGQLEPGVDLRLWIIGRLQSGWSIGQARAALTIWAKQLTSDLPDAEKAANVILQSNATAIRLSPQVIVTFSPLMAAFGLVLLLACANVANMMLARAMARQREIGIRLSLGAGRRRLIRQLLTESVLLAIPAGLAGFFVSRATIDLGVRAMFATLPSDMAELIPAVSLPPDVRVFVFMLLAALVSAFLFGLAPAIQSTRANVMLAARGEFTSDVRPMRLRNALVIGQITVCALLLISTGVMIRGAREMRNVEIGFRTKGALFLELSEKDRSKVLSRLATTPVIEGIAAVASIPLDGMLPNLTISARDGQTTVNAWHNHVSPEFFNVLEIPILEGRSFTPDEAAAGAPVAIISELAARSLWLKGNAVGREISIQRDPQSDWGEPLPRYPAVRVVGVARNIISCSIPYGPDPALIYFPSTLAGHGSLMVRVRGDVETARRALVSDLDATFPGAVNQIHPMDQAFELNVYPFRVAAWVGSALGGLALLLTLSGIYGVLSYLITQRTKEIGIRMALGATTAEVTRLVLKQSGRLAVVGVALGTALALGVSRLFASHLVFVNTFDAVAYVAGVMLVVTAALVAAFFPSRRAARIDPSATLRYD